ncbi:hypothetical protein B0T19DRAFT_227421 [Cercophora scortea]|uniref:BHLH domain-containing protein n=1 Tax=Cercophora scortea TaxID=314031 RepID=A0AAE0IH89_9PEZI|nr:hypothetical protein B0T19DRAFT_227421 [Cercophora scortea]
MHPMATNFSVCSLSTKGEYSSFPERHLTPRDSLLDWPEPVEIPNLQGHWATYSPPELGALEPDLITFSPRNWLDQQSQLPVHRTQHTTKAAFPEAPIDDLHHAFSPPVPQTTPGSQTGWDMLLLATDQSTTSFPWSPTQPAIKIEDDSDSIWSLNDSQEDLQSLPSAWLPAQKFKRRRSIPKVTKPSRQSTASTAQVRHFASLGKQLVRSSVPDRLELSETAVASHSSDFGNPFVSGGTIDLTSDDFSAKLHSKRVAHKLSEKSRRNRLTAAIREIQKLLPQDAESDERPPGSLISKVDVVEMAIGYIKRLKQENAATVKRAEEAEGRLRASHPTVPHNPNNDKEALGV